MTGTPGRVQQWGRGYGCGVSCGLCNSLQWKVSSSTSAAQRDEGVERDELDCSLFNSGKGNVAGKVSKASPSLLSYIPCHTE